MRPLRWPRGRSVCVMSPVTQTLLSNPMRVRNIFICSGEVFCASSRMMNELDSVRPRMNASGAISIVPSASIRSSRSASSMSWSASYSGRRYGSTFSSSVPGKKPSRSPASTAGRVRMMRLICLSSSARTASATARYVLPVPAGPTANTMSLARTRSTYCRCAAPLGAIGRPARGVRMVSPNTPWIVCGEPPPPSPPPCSSLTARTTSSDDSARPASARLVELLERAPGRLGGGLLALDGDLVAAQVDLRASGPLDELEPAVVAPAERLERLGVVECELLATNGLGLGHGVLV